MLGSGPALIRHIPRIVHLFYFGSHFRDRRRRRRPLGQFRGTFLLQDEHRCSHQHHHHDDDDRGDHADRDLQRSRLCQLDPTFFFAFEFPEGSGAFSGTDASGMPTPTDGDGSEGLEDMLLCSGCTKGRAFVCFS